ncbi:Fc.00g019280.m01.CDS01 [Cosmosporella sp. VM-42]
MGVGRFFCVALPFALTIGSIIFLLVGSLAGVADKGLYVFRIDVEDLSINPADVDHIVDNVHLRRAAKTDNITAADLGLSKVYDVSLWGYCHTDQDGDRHCTKAKFDWASSVLNTSYIEDFGSAAGVDIDLPDELVNALKAFKKVTKWTEVAFIAALIALGVEILLGIFANCSRIFSCFTYIVSGLATALVIAAASLATALAAIVVGAVEATAKWYGVHGKINTTFLGTVWIAVAFAIGASLFWLFTICCCKPEHRSRSSRSSRKNRQSDGEKLLPKSGSGYAPLGNDHEMTGGYYNQNQSQSQYGAPRYPSGAARSDLAYEPYSHRA